MRRGSVNVLRRLLVSSGERSARQAAAACSWRSLTSCPPCPVPPTHISDSALSCSSFASRFLSRSLSSSSVYLGWTTLKLGNASNRQKPLPFLSYHLRTFGFLVLITSREEHNEYLLDMDRALPTDGQRLDLDFCGGSGNICLVKTEEEFSGALNKIKEESSPAILYFTAAWCGPCRFMSPVLEDLSGKYPKVTTYKIDIDQEGIQDKLFELRIDSVPRLHFFKDGKKVDEIIGADIERLKNTIERLYEV